MEGRSLDNLKKRTNEKIREERLGIQRIVNSRSCEKTKAVEVTGTLACPPYVLGVSGLDTEQARKTRMNSLPSGSRSKALAENVIISVVGKWTWGNWLDRSPRYKKPSCNQSRRGEETRLLIR
jgi:hypothetical protein